MSHIKSNKDDLLKRVKRIAGQVQAIERALEGDADCAKTLHLWPPPVGRSMGCLTRSSKTTPASTSRRRG